MKLGYDFFHRDCTAVAPELVGKLLRHTGEWGTVTLRISETEAYRGADDSACHAFKGRTPRNALLYERAGTIYIYLCYGIHWLLNVVTGEESDPQAVLIRACVEAGGPGKLTKALGIDKSLNGKDIYTNGSLSIEDDGRRYAILPDTRVGIGYARPEDQARLWRFKMGAPLGE